MMVNSKHKKNLLVLVLVLCSGLGFAQNCLSAKKIVVIGSSTAAGAGASLLSNAWVGLYTSYSQGINPSNTIINLAVGGYTTYQVLPTGTTNPGNRPAVDTSKNITAALSYSPDAIIVNLPTNDTANGYTLAETEANFQTIVATATAAHVPIWITTSQPRNLDQNERNLLIGLRDWVNKTYGSHAIDFWTTVANSDGTINPTYDSGDGIHLNNAGHAILYNRMVANGLLNSLCNGL